MDQQDKKLGKTPDNRKNISKDYKTQKIKDIFQLKVIYIICYIKTEHTKI